MSTPGGPEVVSVHPAPDAAVLTAIVAAVEEAWPRPRPAGDSAGRRTSAWRFSGRWWSKPTALRRDRPWAG
ncbi:MAG TPA: hypothetical protein VN791_07280 [Acidimicrobiales bacterium]|nr:hypothetical protein [Acidimicrobiales bacterium]